ncbi:hypothetical protein BO94DRAFT_244587 [Aspergillus sclerotioniger CBS 115572]|uniref:Uncharacterized protein n=1 Tax=Aspergillus sclerotioniger CBS 115572 TaxID=1450535 RepID=A0A317VKI0_9EURO|nr:hypothetical protein BO94DRAFT_244587 [Aspergillus sclerotioniger CBS 115572]PWY72440.1 hypothetical protein BO94DRAFT_244587 [Aspergillus sclerotioniger CBS 115572]
MIPVFLHQPHHILRLRPSHILFQPKSAFLSIIPLNPDKLHDLIRKQHIVRFFIIHPSTPNRNPHRLPQHRNRMLLSVIRLHLWTPDFALRVDSRPRCVSLPCDEIYTSLICGVRYGCGCRR